MRVTSMGIAVMVMAPKLGRMEVATLEIGKMIKKMEEGLILWLMVMFLMVVGQMDFYMDMEFIDM